MGSVTNNVGQLYPLKKTLRNALASLAMATAIASFAWLGTTAPLEAGGYTRSISMFHVHTKESITITYMQNGRYVPSAMKKINYFMRDWRRNSAVTIDPRTLNLMWELHADLGSKRPIHIVCGYRSGKTNAFLKRKGRNVAKTSQHVKGKAIDFYFPDVPTVKIRNSALVRRVGGVGYYRSSAGPTGFLHVDTGNVRHWGPAISKSQWASIMREGKKTVGRRKSSSGNDVFVASAEDSGSSKKSIWGIFGSGKKKKSAPETAPEIETIPQVTDEEIEAPNYTGFDEDLTDLVSDAAVEPQKPKKPVAVPAAPELVAEAAPEVVAPKPAAVALAKPKKQISATSNAELASLALTAATEEQADAQQTEVAAGEAPAEIKRGKVIPKPRLKPTQIVQLALAEAAAVNIEPASAEPDSSVGKKVAKTKVLTAEVAPAKLRLIEDTTPNSPEVDGGNGVVKSGKADFAAEIRAGQTDEVPLIRPMVAASGKKAKANKLLASAVVVDVDQLVRQNGRPEALDSKLESVLPKAAILDDEPAPESAADGKTDMQVVNREGKGNFELTANN